MKKDKTIRERLIPIFLVSTCIPIILFAVFSMFRLSQSVDENTELQIENNLKQADQSLNMILDKYDTLLYDLCTNDGMIEIVNDINQDRDTLEGNSSWIRHELSHICNRNDGIAGITIITESGQTIFYDRLTGSSASTTWAGILINPSERLFSVLRNLCWIRSRMPERMRRSEL